MSKRKPSKVKTEAETIFTPVNSSAPAKTAEELKTLAEQKEQEANDIPMVSTEENPEPHRPVIGEIISRPSKEPEKTEEVVTDGNSADVESATGATGAMGATASKPAKKATKSAPKEKVINPERPLLFSADEYDSKKPEDTFRAFIRNVKDMVKKYEANIARIAELEDEMQDVMHFMEMAKPKNVPTGYKLYKKLTDIRKERRACKNENDLLKPVYDMFHGTKLLDQLSFVQGECGKAKKAIDGRAYAIRTHILEDMID